MIPRIQPVDQRAEFCIAQIEGTRARGNNCPARTPPLLTSTLSWTAPCLATQIHRRSFLTRICRVKQWPFSPSGEKLAVRPDEGAFACGSCIKRPPHPSPLPQFFASILPSNNTLSLRKKSRERGQHGAVQSAAYFLSYARVGCSMEIEGQ